MIGWTDRAPRQADDPARNFACLRRLTIATVLILVAVTTAQAQTGGGGHRGGQKNQQQAPQTSSTPAPASSSASDAWPRLDAGAVLCSSREDLIRYQALSTGGATVASSGRAPDCHVIQKQAGIEILDRDGPSRTQIATTDDSKQTGWTNTYLPSAPPESAGAVSGTKK